MCRSRCLRFTPQKTAGQWAPIIAVGVHLRHGVLHPVEEERVRGLDVVGRLGLLHGEAEEGPLVVAHEPEARPGVQVVELAAAEVRRNLSYQLGQIDGPVCVPMFRI